MSDVDGFSEHHEKEVAQIKQEQRIILTPLYQQFTHKFVALLLTVMVMIGLIITLFYQNNIQNNTLVEEQLVPLTQELKQINALQKAEKLVTNLLVATNADNFVELHAELIATNRQLLQQNSSNVQTFQQWLNESQLAEDIVSRIQGNHARNQQLKQSSIIQLQLMLVSITPIINDKLSSKKSLHKQLQADQAKDRVTYSQINNYTTIVQQLDDLQELKTLLAEILLNFEQLSIYSSIESFEQLRLEIEQGFSQHKQLISNGKIKAMADVNQQFYAFEKIVLTEQRALAKWRGGIRLAQKYQLNLKEQQKRVKQLLLVPYKATQVNGKGIINDLLEKFDIQLSNKNIIVILSVGIGLMLSFFFYLLWQLREQIKITAQQGVEIIENSLQVQEGNIVANCAETQQIMNHVQSITKPQHNEDEFQELSKRYQSNQQLIEQEKQALERLEKCNEQQRLDSKEQIEKHFSNELQRYLCLENSIFPIIQQHQVTCFNPNIIRKNDVASVSTQLTLLRQQIAQFHLALEMKLDKSVLNLGDINLINEIYVILFNKQQEQQNYGNQLFISYDEQLLREAKIDFLLFQQLISLFIDIALTDCKASQLHLQVQLHDKNAGQQLVHFSVKVKNQSIDILPSLIAQLIDSQSTAFVESPFIDVFNTLFAKQHGENLVAQLVEEGYQLSFELPLAIATTGNCTNKVTLENIHLMLLSSDNLLAELVENIVLSAKGKFELLARIDSFEQQLTAKYLNNRKLDLLIVSSDIASNHFDLITQQIDNLPHSLQPKLMVLQSKELDYDRFGFYSQAEQVFCKDAFLDNIIKLLASNELNNQLFPCEPFIVNQYVVTELPLLLAVHSPQQYQNLQRLLHWLGLQVQVVSHKAAQQALWQTGQYSLLITEFTETALLEMASKPLVDIGVFSLTDLIPHSENSSYFENWHISKLAKEATLDELTDALAPWLLQTNKTSVQNNGANNYNVLERQDEYLDDSDNLVITEVAKIFTDNDAYEGNEAAFDFAQYLQHQGTVELALFMLDDYTQENHQQLDSLIEAIKAKDIEEAKSSISALALNAEILSAQVLKSLCTKWLKLLSGSETPSSLKKVNALLKDTRVALNEIDEYADAI